MKLSDYIAQFLVEKGITEVFGYQGTMIAHLVDSFSHTPGIRSHSSYHEQGAAFAACGYAQMSGGCACAYATSGPGAVNLLSGIAEAYFDSLPVIFFTGQLNTYEYSGIEGLRQQGFQEIDILSMAKPVTKYAVQIRDPEQIVRELNLAYEIAMDGRRGPVLLDLPMNIQRAQITQTDFDPEPQAGALLCAEGGSGSKAALEEEKAVLCIRKALRTSSRPVIMLGNGMNEQGARDLLSFARELQIPVVTSVPACCVMASDDPLNFGCIGGAYGHRKANMIAGAKSDLLLCFGISLCTRQIGTKMKEFAREAALIRIDIDEANLKRRIHESGQEDCFPADANRVAEALRGLMEKPDQEKDPWNEKGRFHEWFEAACVIREELDGVDREDPERRPNRAVESISGLLADARGIGVDVGQHMVWTYQSFRHHEGQKLLFSGGHGAMGYGLPAAVGAYYACKAPVACICGDGAFQMNLQELQWVVREQIPIRIIVMNNQSLGMIRHLQRDYFSDCYEGTSPEGGFTSASFTRIAEAYGIRAGAVDLAEAPEGGLAEAFSLLKEKGPVLLEIRMDPGTYAYPKTCLGEPIYNQQPYVPRDIFERLMEL